MSHRRIKNHNPRKGTETTFIRENVKIPESQAIKNHNPRKGTETRLLGNLTNSTFNIKNHNPRKGTETSYISKVN